MVSVGLGRCGEIQTFRDFFEGTKCTGLSELLIGDEEDDSLVFVLNNDGWWSQPYTEEQVWWIG